MSVEVIMQYFVNYGAIAIFVIVLLEYLNLPGFPAGIIMPLAGIWAARGGLNFFVTMVLYDSSRIIRQHHSLWIGEEAAENYF